MHIYNARGWSHEHIKPDEVVTSNSSARTRLCVYIVKSNSAGYIAMPLKFLNLDNRFFPDTL